MMNLLFVLSVLLSQLFQDPSDSEKKIVNRIRYIYDLKSSIDKNVWKGFAEKKFDLPLVYYTDSVCYVANPTDKFIKAYKPDLIYNNRVLAIYKTELLDSIPFHMETSMTFGKGSVAYNHRSPFMNCSSLEITQQFVPDVNSTEQWATMVIHEYFHGFQFKHKAHITFFEKRVATAADTLQKLYKSYNWYKESVDAENQVLLAALNTNDDNRMKRLIDSFFVFRNQRRLMTKQLFGADNQLIESSFETMEGTARYVEYSLYQAFANKKPDDDLRRTDTSYHAYTYFRNYNLEKDQWLFLSEKTSNYFYATGFNLVRLLDKMKIDYKSRLFKQAGLTIEKILLENH